MEELTDLKKLMVEIETDVTKYYIKNNESAGLRARKNIQALKIIAQKLRLKMIKDRKK